jgi:SAM-dependent methyltransferase
VKYQALQVLETFRIASEKPRVLSIACGSCRDLWSIQIFLKEFSSGEIVLTDLDSEALEFSRARLKSIEGKLQLLHGNIIQLLPRLEKTGGFDLVVAGGLFDYLAKPVVKYLIKHVYRYLLKPGGKLIFTNMAKGNPYRPFIEYFGNLILVERDEEDVLEICRELGLNQQKITFKKEESNLRLIVEITKE